MKSRSSPSWYPSVSVFGAKKVRKIVVFRKEVKNVMRKSGRLENFSPSGKCEEEAQWKACWFWGRVRVAAVPSVLSENPPSLRRQTKEDNHL